MEAQEWVADNPDAAGAVFASYNKAGTAEQVAAMLRTHTHHHHPVDGALKQAAVLRPGTDPTQFAERVCVDVLAT